MVFTRGRSAKRRLKIDWDVPVFQEQQRDNQRTGTRRALMRSNAIEFLAGKDKRPLLIMRDCSLCKGSDMAMLSRTTNNERTQLLTHWFHCVRLPANVLRKDHPLHTLFPEKDPPHVRLVTRDGKTTRDLHGDHRPSLGWSTMTKILRDSYKGDPRVRVKKLLTLLSDFDTLDAKAASLKRRTDRELEEHGPRSAKFKRLRARFTELRQARVALLARELKLRDLGIR